MVIKQNKLPKNVIPLICDSLPIELSFCLFYFENNSLNYVGNNENIVFPAASVIKIPLAIYILKLYEQNKIDINQEVEIKSSDKVGGAGVIKDLSITKLKIIDLITLAIIISDNTASNILIDIIEEIEGKAFEKLNSFFSSLSLKESRINRKFMVDLISPPVNFTTTFEINYILYKLTNFELLNEENTIKLIKIMLKQQYTEKIPMYLDNYYVANKTGDISGISLDSAIIFKSNDIKKELINKNYFILSVFIKFGNFTGNPKTSRNIVNTIISEISFNLLKLFET